MNKNLYKHDNYNKRGIVLLITLVILVVVSMLGYTFTSRVTSWRLRNQYLIDYSKARYGCDSALKYVLTTLKEIDPNLISRPDKPDFSDLFALDAAEYKQFLDAWAIQSQEQNFENSGFFDNLFDSNDANSADIDVLDTVSVPGPYGAPWPYITEPAEFEMGSVKVRIEIEDENAKYPLGWAMIEDREIQREIDAGFVTFCEMSGLDYEQIEALKANLNELKKIRPFKINFEPVITTTREPVRTTSSSQSSNSSTTNKISRTVLTVSTQISNQTVSFARFFNSSLLDKEVLAKPIYEDDNRNESALKYISTWGTRLVNVNTAPRHVLEAAFIFGGNQVEIADQIIEQRKIQPIENIEDLQKKIYGYSDSIEKCKTYITTKSTFFTIKITATSGLAKASSVIAIKKEGNNIKRIASINS